MAAVAAFIAMTMTPKIHAQITFDDFNANEGRFNLAPNFSGSSANVAASSTADRVTTDGPLEGAGHERLVFIPTTEGSAIRCRFLSGSGSAGNNIAFATSAGEDGWIGLFVKTTVPDWTVQLWIEGPSNNGGVPKTVIADGEWHLYEWNLDDDTGGPDGWGSIAGILGGTPEVQDGNHTIDSVVFRHPTAPASSTLYMDFVAKSASGSISNLLSEPCVATSGVGVASPVTISSAEVTVTSASASATALTVYQYVGGVPTAIGTKTTGITAGDNSVPVTGLVKNAIVVGTQTVNGQESCIPTADKGLFVGGGPNPSIRAALTIRETISTGPVGEPGDTASANLHFLGASAVSGGAPINAPIIYPSNGWQTVTFERGTNAIVGDTTIASGTPVDGAGYNAFDSVSILVYAKLTLPNGATIYSAAPTGSAEVSSNDVFAVNWSWDAAPGADGYRVIRSYNFAGYLEAKDVATTSLSDDGTGWSAEIDDNVVTPNTLQSGASVQWNPSASNTNNLPGDWGILESICFAISDQTDTGPFDLYIDNLKNGTTVFQDFELAPANTTDYAFRQPRFSGTTSGNLTTVPDIGQVSNRAADSGTKSFRVSFQWNGTNTSKWLRLTTSGVNNPQVNLNEPISFRLLMQPVGAPAPTPPPAPAIAVTEANGDLILNWTGGHRLQTAVNVTGAYTNVPQVLSPNIWTNVTSGAFLGPWTNTYTDPNRFFRLVD